MIKIKEQKRTRATIEDMLIISIISSIFLILAVFSLETLAPSSQLTNILIYVIMMLLICIPCVFLYYYIKNNLKNK